MYQYDNNKIEETVYYFEAGIKSCDDSVLLHFAYADYLENHGNIERAKYTYEKLLYNENNHSIAYITYMRFTRRVYGKKEAQKIFYRPRKSDNITIHLYLDAASIEYYVNKDIEVARKIFELGMKKYITITEYILEYINFLFNIQDQNNLRVVYEKVLGVVAEDQAIEIWNSFQKFETLYGNLESNIGTEKRRSDYYPNSDPSGIYALVNRYRFMNLWPCSPQELFSFEGGEKVEKEEKRDKAIISLQTSSSDKFVKPDMTKLVIYKPDMGKTSHGGLPPAIFQLLQVLPHGRWEGGQIDIEGLCKVILESSLKPPKMDMVPEQQGMKRKDRDDETIGPSTDVYRERQAARLKISNEPGRKGRHR